MNMDDLKLLDIVKAAPQFFSKGFLQYLAANTHVYREFEVWADRLRAQGRTHYSALGIIHGVRLHTDVHEVGTHYKVTNNCAPDFARLYILCHLEAAAFFSIHNRKLSAEGSSEAFQRYVQAKKAG